MRGRRLITFTDSRQGTARFSGQLQIDAVRNWARGFIYHDIWCSRPAIGPLEEELAALAAMPDLPPPCAPGVITFGHRSPQPERRPFPGRR